MLFFFTYFVSNKLKPIHKNVFFCNVYEIRDSIRSSEKRIWNGTNSLLSIIKLLLKMIIDEVVWNVIKNKHCSFRMKYFSSYIELFLRTSAVISTTLQDSVIASHVHSPIHNTPQSDKKKVFAIFIWKQHKEPICLVNSGKSSDSTSPIKKLWNK
jgi:hypothetical protein